MINNMRYSLFFISFVAATVHASGEVTFLHSPKSIKFLGNEAVDQSLLKEIYSASMGFTTNEDSDWSGLLVSDPFAYAEGCVVLYVEGVDQMNVKGHSFAMNTNEDEDVTWLMLERRVRNRFPSQNNTLMRVELSEGPDAVEPYSRILGDIDIPILPETSFLDSNVTEDRDFLSEIALMQEIMKKVHSGAINRDGFPDVYWFVLRGLHGVWDLHGEESLATEEAQQLLINIINDLKVAFTTAYKDRVLISLITSDVAHTRQVRSTGEEGRNSSVPDNLAFDYDELYPVIFNICLWLMVLLFMAVVSVSIGFLHMDPGKDSIIYRMTNMKSMKKDN